MSVVAKVTSRPVRRAAISSASRAANRYHRHVNLLQTAKQAAQASEKKLPPNVYRGVGVVEEIRKETATVQINHEEIADVMSAMSMPLKGKGR